MYLYKAINGEEQVAVKFLKPKIISFEYSILGLLLKPTPKPRHLPLVHFHEDSEKTDPIMMEYVKCSIPEYLSL